MSYLKGRQIEDISEHRKWQLLNVDIQCYNVQFSQMREGKNLILSAISEWIDCYIDYQYLKIYIAVITRFVNETTQFQQLLAADNILGQEQNDNQQPVITKLTFQQHSTICQGIKSIKLILDDINSMFQASYQNEAEICYLFCILKLREIQDRYRTCLMFNKTGQIDDKRKLLVPYSQYVYVQAYYLKKMMESNTEAERKILKKHKKYAQKMVETCEPYLENKLNVKKIKHIVDQFEDFYVELRCSVQKKTRKSKKKVKRDYLRSLTDNDQTNRKDTFIFGLWVGIFLAVVIFMSLLLVYEKKSVETDPIFNRDFPVWRGIAYIIFYIWVLGLNIFCFQKFKISHHIILDFNSHKFLHSTQVFKIAGLLSTLFAAVFTIYALNLAGIINLGYFPSQHLALIVWGLLFLFLFNPLPIIYFRSRIFILKLFARIFLSPFIGVPFVIGWATDQLLSLITPFEDMVYSVCFYTSLDFTDTKVTNNNCRNPAKIAVFVFAAIIFCYRILQCIRQGYDKKKYFFEHQFFNTVKYAFSLLTLIFSYLWKSGNQNIFAAWLTFAIASTLYSYAWDLKVDWALLQKKSDYCLLRNDLTYNPKSYYVMMISNLALRLAWVLTLSPNITDKTFGSPQLFRLVTGALQIIRRGIWNILRLERQQLKNCNQFKAITSSRNKLEGQIKLKLEESRDKFNSATQQRIVQQDLQIQEQQYRSEGQSSQNQKSKNGKSEKVEKKQIRNLKDVREKIVEMQRQKKERLVRLEQKRVEADIIINNLNIISNN